jgi:hypothetical protein
MNSIEITIYKNQYVYFRVKTSRDYIPSRYPIRNDSVTSWRASQSCANIAKKYGIGCRLCDSLDLLIKDVAHSHCFVYLEQLFCWLTRPVYQAQHTAVCELRVETINENDTSTILMFNCSNYAYTNGFRLQSSVPLLYICEILCAFTHSLVLHPNHA